MKETQKYIDLSTQLSIFSKITRNISDKIDSTIEIIEDVPKVKSTEQNILLAKNIKQLKDFYEKIIFFKKEKSNLKKELNINSTSLNNYLIEIKIGQYNKLKNETEIIKEYKNITIVDKNIQEAKKILKNFESNIEKYFFNDLKKSELDFVENKQKISYFVQKIIDEKKFVEVYVQIIKTKLFERFEIKNRDSSDSKTSQNESKSDENINSLEEIKTCSKISDFLENFDKNLEKVKLNSDVLLKENLSKVVNIQLNTIISEEISRKAFKNAMILERTNKSETLPQILKILYFADKSKIKGFKINEIKNVVNNLVVELKKQYMEYKVSKLNNIDPKIELLSDILELFSDDFYLNLLKTSANTLKIQNFKDFLKVYEKSLKKIIFNIKNNSLKAFFFKFNNLSLLKKFYPSICEINVQEKICDLGDKIVEMYENEIKSEKLETKQEKIIFLENFSKNCKYEVFNEIERLKIVKKFKSIVEKDFNLEPEDCFVLNGLFKFN